MKSYSRNRIFTLNNPTAPRICPELAVEIGLNESILLLQYEFWLATEGEEHDDNHVWVRKPVREVQAVFQFWCIATINKTLQRLLLNGYLVAGEFDNTPGKSARWIRFDFNRLERLKSIKLHCSESEQPSFTEHGHSVQDLNTRPLYKKSKRERGSATLSNLRANESPIRRLGLCRLPEDFTVTPDMRTWAATNAPGIDIHAETEKFCDKARADGKTAVDWAAGWRNWMKRAVEYRDQHPKVRKSEVTKQKVLTASDIDAMLN